MQRTLGAVEHDGRESRRHLGVQADLDTRLDLVLALESSNVNRGIQSTSGGRALHQKKSLARSSYLDEHVQQLLGVQHRLPEVRHQANEGRVPLVHDLRERRRTGRHQDLTHAVLEGLLRLLVDAKERLRGALLGGVVLVTWLAISTQRDHSGVKSDTTRRALHCHTCRFHTPSP